MTFMIVGEWGVRDPNFSLGQHIEGGAHLLSLAASTFPSPEKGQVPIYSWVDWGALGKIPGSDGTRTQDLQIERRVL